MFIEIVSEIETNSYTIVGVVYIPHSEPKADMDIFSSTLFDIMDTVIAEHKHCVVIGYMNVDLLKFSVHTKKNDYLDNIFQNGFIPTITKPTRITSTSATLIGHMHTNNITTSGKSGIIMTDVADHFGTFYISHEKIKNTEMNMYTKTSRSFSDNKIEK